MHSIKMGCLTSHVCGFCFRGYLKIGNENMLWSEYTKDRVTNLLWLVFPWQYHLKIIYQTGKEEINGGFLYSIRLVDNSWHDAFYWKCNDKWCEIYYEMLKGPGVVKLPYVDLLEQGADVHTCTPLQLNFSISTTSMFFRFCLSVVKMNVKLKGQKVKENPCLLTSKGLFLPFLIFFIRKNKSKLI